MADTDLGRNTPDANTPEHHAERILRAAGSRPTIYHGTPITPRAALLEVGKGRAICVSFHRPQDVEAVEAISPAIMFRQRRVFVLARGAAQGAGMGRDSGLDAVFQVVGDTPVYAWPLGGHPRYAGSAKPAQRRTIERLAFRAVKGRAAVAYGRADRTPVAAMRAVRSGMLGLDRRGQGYRLPGLSRTHGRSCAGLGQFMAGSAHDARDRRCPSLPLSQRGQHELGAERMAI